MSAYQVNYETIGRVLKAISKAGCYSSRYKQIEKLKQQYEKNAGIVFDQLLELNRLSLKGRYEDYKSMFFEVDRSKAVWFSRQLGHNDYQLLKSLNSKVNSCKNVDFQIFGLSLATINFLLSFTILILILKVIKNERNK